MTLSPFSLFPYLAILEPLGRGPGSSGWVECGQLGVVANQSLAPHRDWSGPGPGTGVFFVLPCRLPLSLLRLSPPSLGPAFLLRMPSLTRRLPCSSSRSPWGPTSGSGTTLPRSGLTRTLPTLVPGLAGTSSRATRPPVISRTVLSWTVHVYCTLHPVRLLALHS